MKKTKLIFLVIICFISQNVFCNNIAVIDIEEIIDNNESYIKILNDIENSQIQSSTFLNEEELKLENLYKEIEESKILLSEIELNSLINKYNANFNDFSLKVKDFNDHYQNQILEIRKKILQEIIVLSEKYAKKNNIDLILDATSYLIASNEINMTKTIKEELKKITLNLEFKNFEKY